MATYDFSTLIASGNFSQAFLPADILTFNDSIHASDLFIATAGSNITLKLSTGFTLTLTSFAQNQIASANFKFADGSKLVIGDGLSTTLNDNLANTLVGTEFSDYLDGGLGNDKVSYATASSGVSVDLSRSTAQDTLGAGVDKLLNIENVIGSIYGDILLGDDAHANILDGGTGIDVMDGRNGDDTYYVTAGDLATDTGATNADVAYAAVDYALGSGIDNLVLTGTSAVNGRGNSLNNTLIGNTGNNMLDGVDAATAGTGTDTLRGLAGNDTYYVHSVTDVVDETTAGSGGIDMVISNANFDMNAKAVNVENMRLVGAALSGNGNILANTIYGNSNNNVLSGGAGNDALADLLGGDDILIGGSGVDNLKGGSGDDILIGGTAVVTTPDTAGDNAVDALIGGTGDDTYYVTDASDTVNEAANAGNDIVNASVTYALNDAASIGIENLTLLVATNINGTGNSLVNTITGNNGNNTLVGGSRADTLSGGIGNDILTGGKDALTADLAADTLDGGTGNDTYNVTDASDVVNEADNLPDTNDLVNTTVTYALNDTNSAGVEKLTLMGSGNITGTGNSKANIITGNSGNNTLNGGADTDIDTLTDALGGNDILDGGAGADIMSGGIGADTYIVDDSSDSITENPLHGTDLVNASVNYTLSANVENLTLTGANAINGEGNTSANTIVGNDSANTLKGGDNADYLRGGGGNDLLIGGTVDVGTVGVGITADADTMEGGAGNDTYSVDYVFDVVTEASGVGTGTDLVKARVSYVISVNVENLKLTGITGAVTDTDAINGTGNDSANAVDGNDGNNTLSGLAGADTLTGNAGNDTLDGGTEADKMSGGLGNDTYIVDDNSSAGPSASTGDTVIEAAGQGTDQVNASVTYTISDVDVENLTLTGTNTINGTGNASANILIGNGAINILTGLDGNDSLDGKAGADFLRGGNGIDTYFVDDSFDDVNETIGTTGSDAIATTVANANLDTVYANVNLNYTISNVLVENLTLTGSGATTGTGNSSANILTGNANVNTLDGSAGADKLNGGAGKDTLIGGAGNDTFIFSLSADSSLTLFDVISDFKVSSTDKIDLTAIDAGTLAFHGSVSATPSVVSGAHTVDYYSTGGNTFVIADTDGVASTIDFKVQLTGYTSSLSSSDFNL